jgi:hypothetical protein
MPNYNPYGYNNYNGYNFNQYPQQPQTNQYAFVNGIEGAKAYQVMPNQTMMLMDNDNPICYMKQSNSMGQSTLRYFKLVEVSEQELRGQAQTQSEYVLKSDFDALSKKVEDLLGSISKNQKEGE